MPAIIADTTPLYALVDPGDRYHQQARRELQRIQTEDITVIIPYPIALEAYSLVLYRLGIYQAITFAQNLRNNADLIHPTEQDYQLAWQKVQQYPDQKLTLFDAVTAAVAKRLDYSVWTYDYHFEIMLISVWR